MARTDAKRAWLGLLLIAGMAYGAPARAEAQATAPESSQLPRTLRDGAPRQRFRANAGTRPATRAAARATPSPSIAIDPRVLAGRAAPEQRSEALLQREIQLLERVIQHTHRLDNRRADALLRLSYALQELMWLQKVRVHRMQDARGRDCRCAAAASAPMAVACSEPAAEPEVVATR